MQNYEFTRNYSVPANTFREARIKFSRALEDNQEDQFYIGTKAWFPQTKKGTSISMQLLELVPWFLDGFLEQLFGYSTYHR